MVLCLDDGGAAEFHPRAVARGRSSGIDTLQRKKGALQFVEGILADAFDQGRERHAGGTKKFAKVGGTNGREVARDFGSERFVNERRASLLKKRR